MKNVIIICDCGQKNRILVSGVFLKHRCGKCKKDFPQKAIYSAVASLVVEPVIGIVRPS